MLSSNGTDIYLLFQCSRPPRRESHYTILRNLCLCGDIHQAVFGITVESIVFDTCFTVPCDGHQVGVGIESKGFNGDYSTAYAYRTQIFTITESIEPYGFYFVGDDDVLYLCAL